MASIRQMEAAKEVRLKILSALSEAAFNRDPCPRYDQLAAMVNRDERTVKTHVRALHKDGTIIIRIIAHCRMTVDVNGSRSRASILRREEEKTNDKSIDYDIVVDEKKNFEAFLAKFNLRGLMFEDSRAACKPERPWTKRPEPRTSSGVAQYG